MNKLFLMKNPELFQGQKYLYRDKNYFEGWYFKNTNKKEGISFIPGISIDDEGKRAFIQIITDSQSYYLDYNMDDFKFDFEPFSIRIGSNIFSKEGIHIDIQDDVQNLNIYGDVKYSNISNIKTSFWYPNIMGPFSYVPFMECNHAILSMKSKTEGSININGNKIDFNNGIGYIEKDWGYSFPKSYIWCQGNNFKKTNASFMLSVADIPFKILSFRGVICVLIIDNQEFKFTTYNNTKIVKYRVDDNSFSITLKKGSYIINIQSKYDTGLRLVAPVKGKMEKNIKESINSSIAVTLKKDKHTIFSDVSTNCGLEIV